MSSRLKLEARAQNQLEFVTRLSNATLSSLIKKLPAEVQLELGDHSRVLDVDHEGKRYVVAGGAWRKQRDKERRELRMSKGEAILVKLAAVKRKQPDAQKLASQAGRALDKLEWKAKGETTDVPTFLRELQSIRMGYLRIGKKGISA